MTLSIEKLAAILCLAASAANLAGCSRAACGLHVWAIGSEADALQRMASGFERQHEGLRVCVENLAWSSAQVRLVSAVAAGDPPDIAQVGNTDLATLVTLHAVIAQPPVAPDFFPGALNVTRFHGQYYGTPWYVDTRLLFYRPDILRRAGFARPARTWNGWLNQMQAVRRVLKRGQYPLLAPINEYSFLEVLALQQQTHVLRDDAQYGNFANPKFRAALTFYKDLFTQRLAPPIADHQLINLWWQMARGDFVFYVSGPWNIGEFRRLLPPKDESLWMTAPMPGPRGPGASLIGGSDFVIFRTSTRKRLATAFIHYMLKNRQQIYLYKLTGDLPARRGPWTLPPLSGDIKLRAFRRQLEHVSSFEAIPEWDEIMDGMRRAAEQVIIGGQSVPAATRNLDRKVNDWLAARRQIIAKNKRKGPVGASALPR